VSLDWVCLEFCVIFLLLLNRNSLTSSERHSWRRHFNGCRFQQRRHWEWPCLDGPFQRFLVQGKDHHFKSLGRTHKVSRNWHLTFYWFGLFMTQFLRTIGSENGDSSTESEADEDVIAFDGLLIQDSMIPFKLASPTPLPAYLNVHFICETASR